MPQWGADDDEGEQLGGGLGDGDDGVVDRLEQDVLHQQVVDGVAAQRQLGEEGDGDALVVALLDRARTRSALVAGSASGDGQRARGDPGETLGVRVPEVHVHSQAHDPCDRRPPHGTRATGHPYYYS